MVMYEALEDFESPAYGPVNKGDKLELDAVSAAAWCSAGLVKEINPAASVAAKEAMNV